MALSQVVLFKETVFQSWRGKSEQYIQDRGQGYLQRKPIQKDLADRHISHAF